MNTVVAQAPKQEPIFLKQLREHFGDEPSRFPIIGESFPRSEHPNLYLAITDYLAGDNRRYESFGVTAQNEHMGIKLAQMADPDSPEWNRPCEALVQYVNIELDDDRVLACVTVSLYLIRDGDRPLAVFIQGPSVQQWGPQLVTLKVMATEHSRAEDFLHAIRRSMHARNVYRGHVISLGYGAGGVTVEFHHLPNINRHNIILPRGVIERIERHAIGFTRAEANYVRPDAISSAVCYCTARPAPAKPSPHFGASAIIRGDRWVTVAASHPPAAESRRPALR